MSTASSNFPALLTTFKANDSVDGLRCRTLAEFIKSGEDAHRALRAQVAKAGLTVEGLRVLMSVADGQNATPGLLAEQIGVSRVVVSHLLARLQISSLVSRERDAVNRRLVRVALTPLGRTTLDRALKACENGMLQITGALNEDSLLELHRACANVNNQVEGMS